MAAFQDLKTARDNLAAMIAAKTEQWLAAGCPPTISIDGESYDWQAWLRNMNEAVASQTDLINKVSAPWLVRSSGRG